MQGCEREEPVRADSNMLSASFTVSPSSGSPGTVFSVNASVVKSGSSLQFRWDWEDDGIWDTAFSPESSTTCVYSSVGYKTIRLEARDESGKSGIAKQEVLVTVASKEMILIPAGEFLMGSTNIGNDDEHPQHKVYLDAFLIGKYEVTYTQYVEFLNAIGRHEDDKGHKYVNMLQSSIRLKDRTYKIIKGWEDRPMEGVSWFGAKAYAEWEGGRLPTEAEWEKAARGENGREWPWGDLWELGRCNSWEAEAHCSTLVGNYPTGVSPYGVHDLAGGIYEWVSDWYQSDYYKISPYRNPEGPEFGMFRVLRGGSWAELKELCRSAVRFGQPPDSADIDFGVRIVKDT